MKRLLGTMLIGITAGCGGNVTGGAQPGDGGGADVTTLDGQAADSPGDSPGSDLDSAGPADGASNDAQWADGGSADAEADSDAADAAWSPVCPETEPALGSPCNLADPSVNCEYEQAWWNLGCSKVLGCGPGNVWEEACSQTCFPAPGPNSPECPSDPTLILQRSPCPDAGIVCNWDQGVTCSCLDQIQNDPDAGAVWFCDPSAGCPSSRPRLGASCSNQTGCDYAASSEYCKNGVWTASPGSGGGC